MATLPVTVTRSSDGLKSSANPMMNTPPTRADVLSEIRVLMTLIVPLDGPAVEAMYTPPMIPSGAWFPETTEPEIATFDPAATRPPPSSMALLFETASEVRVSDSLAIAKIPAPTSAWFSLNVEFVTVMLSAVIHAPPPPVGSSSGQLPDVPSATLFVITEFVITTSPVPGALLTPRPPPNASAEVGLA